MEQVAENRSFGGRQLRFAHQSQVLNCDMHFSLYLPPQAEQGDVPLLTWLSGLTCTDENFVHKAGAQRAAAAHERMESGGHSGKIILSDEEREGIEPAR